MPSVAQIDGLTIPSAVGTPAAAYSVRLLGSAVGISSYTGACMRVRRASDSVEADVGFDTSDELSLTSPISNTSDAQSYTDLADFVDHTGTATDAFIRYWYDQASNNDAGQSTAGSQPKIYDASTGLITENGKPAVDFLSGNTSLINASFKLNPVPLTMFFVAKFPTKGSFQHLIDQSQGSTAGFLLTRQASPAAYQIYYFPDLTAVNLKTSPPTTQSLHALMIKNGEQAYNLNGTTEHSGTAAITNNPVPTNNFVIGTDPDNTGRQFIGTAQEFIFYKSDETDNFTGIETNIDNHFQIPGM